MGGASYYTAIQLFCITPGLTNIAPIVGSGCIPAFHMPIVLIFRGDLVFSLMPLTAYDL